MILTVTLFGKGYVLFFPLIYFFEICDTKIDFVKFCVDYKIII